MREREREREQPSVHRGRKMISFTQQPETALERQGSLKCEFMQDCTSRIKARHFCSPMYVQLLSSTRFFTLFHPLPYSTIDKNRQRTIIAPDRLDGIYVCFFVFLFYPLINQETTNHSQSRGKNDRSILFESKYRGCR